VPSVNLQTVVESQTGRTLVKHAKDSLDGRRERYVFVVRVRVTDGTLEAGDTITVVYGDRSQGSPGLRAGAVSTGPKPILVALDAQGDSRFQLLDSLPEIRCLPGDAEELLIHGPSTAAIGRPIRLQLALIDKENNPVQRAETVALTGRSSEAEYPTEINIPPDQGYHSVTVTPQSPGVLRFHARCAATGLQAVSNPIEVTDQPPARQIYWGDLHSHARYSWDGVGDHPFEYARDISDLDFYALTDHSLAPQGERTRGLSARYWDEYNALTERHHEPNRFVTLHAYECSFGNPYGHHNVYFRDTPGPLIYPSRETLPALWNALKAGDALTIPHHTGKFPNDIDFSVHNAEYRRNFEIYSGHGLSEVYQPWHPLAFEQNTFTSDSRSLKTPTYAQDVWKQGLHLSTIASSDDHRGQPGKPHFGLVAVRAPALTRNDIFQALYDRATYATTGARIILDFKLDQTPMGQVAEVDAPPSLHIRAIGTDVIERVELLKHQAPLQEFAVLKDWHPDSLAFEADYRDTDFQPGAVYYTRLTQKKPVRNRPAMAWSSPVWTREDSGQ
jgi:hypothetical protein